MKLGNLIALPFALVADAVSLGEAGITNRILKNERMEQEIKAIEAIAKVVNAAKNNQKE